MVVLRSATASSDLARQRYLYSPVKPETVTVREKGEEALDEARGQEYASD